MVYHRRDDTRLFEFDPAGKFVREWGVGIYGFEFAHKVRVDSEDNVWAVDEGTNMVIKFNPQGKVVMVLGRRPSLLKPSCQLRRATLRPTSVICSPAPPMSAGIRRATSSYPMATSTIGS